jgi:hypothetical protein
MIVVPMPTSPAELGKLVAEETEKWGKVIRAANIKAEAMMKLIEGESKVVARALEHGGAVAIREKSSHRYFAEP